MLYAISEGKEIHQPRISDCEKTGNVKWRASFNWTVLTWEKETHKKGEKEHILNEYDLNQLPCFSHTFLLSCSPEALTSLFLFAPCVNKSIIFCSGLAFF